MKALWRGYITLGQLGIPVRLFSATQPIRPKFVQLHEKDSSPIERVLKCRDEDREIDYSEVVRAVEHEPGRYITLTNQELERAAGPTIKTIDVKQFCESDAVAPAYYEKPYYIVPARGGERAYALLREVLVRTGKLAVSQFMIYGNDHVAAISAQGDILILNQLRFAGELIPRTKIKTPALPKPHPDEVDRLQAVVNRFSGPFYIEDYHDEYSERLQVLVDRKAQGLPMSRAERPDTRATPEDEIVSALNSTLQNPEQLEPGKPPK